MTSEREARNVWATRQRPIVTPQPAVSRRNNIRQIIAVNGACIIIASILTAIAHFYP